MYIEIFVVAAIIAFIYLYRKNTGDNSYKFLAEQVAGTYEKYAPYSFKVVRQKAKELGQEYTTRQYIIQILLFGVGAAFISYLYFYSIIWSIIYAAVAILIIPYLTFIGSILVNIAVPEYPFFSALFQKLLYPLNFKSTCPT